MLPTFFIRHLGAQGNLASYPFAPLYVGHELVAHESVSFCSLVCVVCLLPIVGMGDRNESCHRGQEFCDQRMLCWAIQAAQTAFPPQSLEHGTTLHMLRARLFLSRSGGVQMQRHVTPIVDHLTSTFRSGVTTEHPCLNSA